MNCSNETTSEKIIRSYPSKKDPNDYERRYSADAFEKYKDIVKTRENYEKWKLGINHRTNRKINIGGKTHDELKYKDFYITYNNGRMIIFEALDGIDCDAYFKETDILKSTIQEYNQRIDDVLIKLQMLPKWNDYVEFDGKKYGIPHLVGNIHRKNDCFGNLVEDYHENCLCNSGRCYNQCSKPWGTQYYKCSKCMMPEYKMY
jgi:hypothetical protein